MSFSERYQGTEYGQPAPDSAQHPGQPEPTKPPRRGRRGLLIGVVAIALVAAVALTAVGSGLLRPGTSSAPSPSPAQSANAGAVVAEKLVDRISKKNLAFRVALTEQLTAGTFKERMTGRLDISGANFKGPVRYVEGKTAVSMNIVYIRGSAYARSGKSPWVRLPAATARTFSGAAEGMFGELTTVGLTSLGAVKRDGRSVHHLRDANWASGFDIDSLADRLGRKPTLISIDKSTIDIFATGTGVPVEAAALVKGSYTLTGKRYLFEARSSYKFSRWGRPVSIKAPAG